MKYNIKRLVRQEDLDKSGLLKSDVFFTWIYDELIKHAESMSGLKCLIKHISKIDIVNPVRKDNMLEVRIGVKNIGSSSLSLEAKVTNIENNSDFLIIENIIIVSVDSDFKPVRHNIKDVESVFIPCGWMKFNEKE